jgi:hypothetical protein
LRQDNQQVDGIKKKNAKETTNGVKNGLLKKIAHHLQFVELFPDK